MKIAFVTNHLEAEKGGVADHVRLLAAECVKQGHSCCLISLNDNFISDSHQEMIGAGKAKIPILRLSSSIPWARRIRLAREFLVSFQPDWVSLQFVSYGYNSKGIIFGLINKLKEIVRGYKVHIMFHELWIGQCQGAKLKERAVGTVQRFFILNLVKHLEPSAVHANTPAYVAILKQYGIFADHLPLFGNIPVKAQNGNDWLFSELRKKGLKINEENKHQFWLFGFFGALPPVWPPEPFFGYLRQAALKYDRKIGIISIGSLRGGEVLWDKLCKTYSSDFVFLKLGYHPADKVSQILNSIDFGIATVPYTLIGKSGTVAAMLEHGLPVIVNRDDEHFSGFSNIVNESETFLYRPDGRFQDKIMTMRRRPVQRMLSQIAAQFIMDLTNASKHKDQ